MSNKLIPSLPIFAANAACVTDDFEGYGCGVFSWHDNMKDAEHNARITGGVAVPVDSIDGEVIIPSLAARHIERLLGDV